jgi:hypothetical protein
MRNGVERDCRVYARHDGQLWRRKLCRQFLDAKSKSFDEQRWGRQWRTLDCDYSVFDMFGCASDSEWIGGVGDDQHKYKLGLEFGQSTGRLHCEL